MKTISLNLAGMACHIPFASKTSILFPSYCVVKHTKTIFRPAVWNLCFRTIDLKSFIHFVLCTVFLCQDLTTYALFHCHHCLLKCLYRTITHDHTHCQLNNSRASHLPNACSYMGFIDKSVHYDPQSCIQLGFYGPSSEFLLLSSKINHLSSLIKSRHPSSNPLSIRPPE